MNQDLQKLLELRANMSYIYGLRKQKKEEMKRISKHLENQKLYIRESNEKYRNNRKIKPQYAADKAELERLEKKGSGFTPLNHFLDNFYCNNIGDFSYGFYVPIVLGAIAGIVIFFLFKEPWLHISTWARTVTFTIIFHIFALAVFAAVFAAGALALTFIVNFLIWLIRLPIRLRRKKRIRILKYKLYGGIGNQKDPYIPDEQAKRICDEDVARYKRIIADDEKQMQKCIDDVYCAEKTFNNGSFIIRKEDYKYLDYLIYLMSSNRAKDIHQALQLLDAQLRHNELMSKLNDLKQSITSSIKSLEKKIEENTFAVRSLEQTVVTRSEDIRSLIQEGNKVSSMQLAKLEKIEKEFSEFKYAYPGLRYYRY